ncbi:unnamed protein product [Ostreobium quekettii]|uniref:3-deoxy-D-manno-octulosonic-acid transferase N-terminal domain-containing protein n=1 Tax=Ostreobium quekettii TaxID=121088 RepID=A0A8S1IPQ6_9CHLO|nr:unnamed protein product [Ostreobium quekettii]|eukprot:evm.model.scf_417.3 EVM.evm.TU.scf_417.3   scf_417:43438-53754(-)
MVCRPSDGALAQFAWTSVTSAIGPVLVAHAAMRRIKGDETNKSMLERLGWSSEPRPPGPLFWFHAQSVGESAVALPVIHRCLLEYEKVNILLTTCTLEAYALLSRALPQRVILQYAPWDLPFGVQLTVLHWRPDVVVFVESVLWPNLIEALHQHGSHLALLNARLSPETFLRWHTWRHTGRQLMKRMMSRFDLVVPQSDVDVGRFRMLGATIPQMPGWCTDLKYAAAMGACVWEMWRPSGLRVMEIKKGVAGRPLWVAASTHDGEEECVGRAHLILAKEWRNLLTIIVPRHTWRCQEVADKLSSMGLNVKFWSAEPRSYSKVDVFVVDLVGELPLLYAISEIAFVGGSLMEGSSGHNLAEAAVAGCAVVVGMHAGHFNRMADELNQAALVAAEEAAAVVNNSGVGGIYDDYIEDESQGPQDPSQPAVASPSSALSPSPADSPRAANQVSTEGRTSSSLRDRPATAPAAMAYAWEFEPWQEAARGAGEPGWLGNERHGQRDSPCRSGANEGPEHLRRNSEPANRLCRDPQMRLPEEAESRGEEDRASTSQWRRVPRPSPEGSSQLYTPAESCTKEDGTEALQRLSLDSAPPSTSFTEDLPSSRDATHRAHSWDRPRTGSANGLSISELRCALTPDATEGTPADSGSGKVQGVQEKSRQGSTLVSGEATQDPSRRNGYASPIQIRDSPLVSGAAGLSEEHLSLDTEDSPRVSIIERNALESPSETNLECHLVLPDEGPKEGQDGMRLSLGEGGQSSVCPSPYPSAASRPCSGVSLEQPPPFTHLPHPTPSSGNSPTSFAETPVWAQATPMSMGATVDGAPTRSPWRAASATVSPTHGRHLSGVPQTPSVSPLAGHSRRDSTGTDFDLYSGLSLRYQGEYILPANHLPYAPHGPAVWRVSGEVGLAESIGTLLREPLERRSRGHAAAQAAAKLATGLVSTVWSVLDEMVLDPALRKHQEGQER